MNVLECYHFDVDIANAPDIAADGSQTIKLAITVLDPVHFGSEDQEILAEVLVSIGEEPRVTVSNFTHTYGLSTRYV